MRSISLIAGWTLVLVLTTVVTWQIVDAAEAHVNQRPASPLNVSAPEFNSTSTSVQSPTTTSERQSTGTSTTTPPNSTNEGTTPATTTTTSPASSTSTTAPETTTTTSASWALTTKNTVGGTVVVAHRPGEVILQAATPAPGFQTEIKKGGPDQVEVEFESDTVKVEIKAEWEHGELEIEVSTEEDEDD